MFTVSEAIVGYVFDGESGAYRECDEPIVFCV